MSDSKDVTSSSSAPTAAPSTPPKPAARGAGIAWFALLVALLSTAGSGWFWYQLQISTAQESATEATALATQTSELRLLSERLGDMKEQLTTLRNDQQSAISATELTLRLQTLENALDTRINTLSDEQREALETVRAVQQQMGGQRSELAILSIGELLKTASLNANLWNNKALTLAALEQALQAINALDDIRFNATQQAVLRAIDQVAATAVLDTLLLTETVNSLTAMVDELPLPQASIPVPDQNPMGDSTESATDATPETGWQSFWAELGAELSDFLEIKVQRVDGPVEPLLSPDERGFLRLNLITTLQKAELAALQGQGPAYDASLQQAEEWVTTYFSTSADATTRFLERLNQLKALSVGTQIPSVDACYTAFAEARAQVN